MISRRQIIASGKPAGAELEQQQQQAASSSSSNATKPSSRMGGGNKSAAGNKQGAPMKQQGKLNGASKASGLGPKALAASGKRGEQQDSDDYVLNSTSNPYEDFQPLDERAHWRGQQQAKNSQQQEQLEPNYRQFDPYSIYSDEEDVWYSEERLFEVSQFSNSSNSWPSANSRSAHSFVSLAGWLAGWLTGWLAGRLAGLLAAACFISPQKSLASLLAWRSHT